MILHYKYFKSNKDFMEFQEKNKIYITQIQPIINSISFKYDESNADGIVDAGIFVVYSLNNNK